MLTRIVVKFVIKAMLSPGIFIYLFILFYMMHLVYRLSISLLGSVGYEIVSFQYLCMPLKLCLDVRKIIEKKKKEKKS